MKDTKWHNVQELEDGDQICAGDWCCAKGSDIDDEDNIFHGLKKITTPAHICGKHSKSSMWRVFRAEKGVPKTRMPAMSKFHSEVAPLP